MRMSIYRAAPLLALMAIPYPARAQKARDLSVSTTVPVASAVRRSSAIAIDGRLDEACWEQAVPARGFRQSQPDEGAPASLPIEVRILYDDQALYIGARMSEPGGVVAPLARRDQLLDASGDNGSFNSLTTDKLIVRLDPYHNHLDDAWFEVNPAGVQGDQFNGDPSWDPIWEAATQVDSAGWTAELRIPFSQLRFSRDPEQTWGLQIWRYVDRLNEQDMWSFRRRNEPSGPAFFGNLTGLTLPGRPRQMEVLPYVVTGSRFEHAAPADPYHDGQDLRLGVGADLKFLLTSSLTLDATLNPDFGQVEVDPATLNLSAFETYYDEKRPFFIAGASAFRFGGMRCMFCSNTSGLSAFYSRRIGRPPQLNGWVSDNAAYYDVPDNTAILGAAKITGRTGNGYTVGVLDAVTGRERARYLGAAGGTEQTQVVEPLTNYFVGRLKKEFRGGATTFGGIVTSTARQLGDSVVSAELRSHAEAAGVDWRHTWRAARVLLDGQRAAVQRLRLARRDRAHPAVERALLPAAGPVRGWGRPVRHPLRPDRRVAPRLRAVHARGQGQRHSALGGDGERPQPRLRGQRPRLSQPRRLRLVQRQHWRQLDQSHTRWYRSIFTSIGGATEYNYDGDRTRAAAADVLRSWSFPTTGTSGSWPSTTCRPSTTGLPVADPS